MPILEISEKSQLHLEMIYDVSAQTRIKPRILDLSLENPGLKYNKDVNFSNLSGFLSCFSLCPNFKQGDRRFKMTPETLIFKTMDRTTMLVKVWL
jgi:hypothetical protein